MESQLLATAKVHWLDSKRGGRKTLPSGSIYAATARFTDQEDELFSVVLRFPLQETSPRQSPLDLLDLLLGQQVEDKEVLKFITMPSKQVEDQRSSIILDEAEIGFFAPELVENKLYPGVKFLLTEGPQIVAECEIQKVFKGDLTTIASDPTQQ